MQIGNTELERVYNECFKPTLEKIGYKAKRVDKHTSGRLLKSEIVNFIQSSDLIIADITNERPNCYLEIGYAMGLDKFEKLILTVKEDHNPHSPNFNADGPRIHFDLSGYDILFWNASSLDTFKLELEKKIKRRLLITKDELAKNIPNLQNDWFTKHSGSAFNLFNENGFKGYMEIRFLPSDLSRSIVQTDLKKASQEAQIHTFGWPIGASDIYGNTEFQPKPTSDGIEIQIFDKKQSSFDYWALNKNGSFYLLKNLFEDHAGNSNKIFFNTRIVRIAESFLYIARLYSKLGFDPETEIKATIKHGNLKGREISSTGRRSIREGMKSGEEEIETEITFKIADIESNLNNLVEQITKPLFIIFNYFELPRSVLDQIVDSFVDGQVT